jgi:hypothetical protein
MINCFGKKKSAKRLYITVFLKVVFLISLPATSFADGSVLRLGDFSRLEAGSAFPEPWKALRFKKVSRQTEYRLVDSAGQAVVEATSRGAASGMMRKLKIDPKRYPLLSWRWKITSVFKNGDVTQKKGDDCPARVYVSFAFDPEKSTFLQRTKYALAKLVYGDDPPHAAISYVWANKAPVGTMRPNPYTDRVQMVVVESGPAYLNTWREETRNIYSDFLAAFNHDPPPISGIAIMCDTDNTGEHTISYFGDILLKEAP